MKKRKAGPALLAVLLLCSCVSALVLGQGGDPRKKNTNSSTTPTPPRATTPPRKNITSLKSADIPEGSRVTITANARLNDYSASRTGDRFSVHIPRANAPRAPDTELRGRGFEDARVHKRGDDVIFSFRIQAGASATATQRNNKIDITFSIAKVESTKVPSSSPAVPGPRNVALHWTSQRVGPAGKLLWVVCFIDSKRGWIAGEGGFLSRTQDGGETWVPQSVLTNKRINDVYFLMDKGFLLAGGDVFVTRDEGKTWKPGLRLSAAAFGGLEPILRTVKFIDKKRGWILGYAGLNESLVLYTEDGGLSWARQQLAPNDLPSDIDFVGENHGWIVSMKGNILRTEDGGKTWQTQRFGGSTYYPLSNVDFRDSQNGIAVGGVGTILLTSDGGDHWISVESPVNSLLLDVQFNSKNKDEGWIVGAKGVILHTEDGGRTWSQESSNTEQQLRSLFITSERKWAVGGDGIVLKY